MHYKNYSNFERQLTVQNTGAKRRLEVIFYIFEKQKFRMYRVRQANLSLSFLAPRGRLGKPDSVWSSLD